ncbi:hypothetical protein TWF106_004407 [Orbilia oligospora]|uniref:mRNA decay factor PAT1 domain-containing protein n=1 Tax=Orbilia oligospora TaxID=2813651 RepID=A0A6G1MIN0_ORBOL|nr:hypothetical protein TWF106_004407 [Orbilia oligospora]KAF3230427.1 hypothetical protein TWF191_010312 [Orbilia oligospora]KAF3260457.1 hypothetical protein TWF192_009738 [Orbilia oligospora]
MSFFGFNTTLPRDRAAHAPHPTQAPGFSQQVDAFAGLSGNSNEKADDDGYDFEDTYDGLGDKLDEGDDEFNDETFGGGNAAAPGKDFDFFGSTAKVANAINEEQLLYARGPKKPTQTAPPSYHQDHQPKAPSYAAATKPKPQPAPKHQIPTEIPELKPEMSLWATTSPEATPAKNLSAHAAVHYLHIDNPLQEPPPTQPNFSQPAPATRKYKSLEEVEAEILAKKQARLAAAQQPPQPQLPPHGQLNQQDGWPGRPVQGFPQHPQMQLQQPPLQQIELPFPPRGMPPPQQNQRPPQNDRTPEHLQRGPMPQPGPGGQLPFPQIPANQQFQGNNIPFPMGMIPPQGPQGPQGPQPPFVGMPPMQPQIMQMTEEERVKFLEEESKRLKRNHKIAQLSRYNGLMTPSDKNFITRIQLQQLVSVNEDSFNEDFYYQVYMAIRARNNPQQPLNQFAQTYLGQQGARGGRARRQDNHLLRMQQQVQRAVAAAKARPKASQLVLEGSLGKISFSNVKTPKPLLSIKKQDSTGIVEPGQKPAHAFAGIDRRSILAAAEDIYRCLLDLDSHERKHPGPSLTGQQPDANTIQWFEVRDALIAKLWRSMRIMEPIKEEPNALHPFIAILSVKKAKEAIPRVFRYIDLQQRITILTMITISLDQVDVIKDGRYLPDTLSLSNETKKKIEGFSQYVLPPLLSYVGDAQLDVITGLLGILLDRVNVLLLSQTQIGLAFLTMFTSRAEIIKQANQADDQGVLKWTQTYDRLFEVLEDHLLDIFPPHGAQVDDMYVWQFLASMAVGANMSQQQKMVSAVKDRVNDNVQASKTLPQEMGQHKLANTNLFLRALGLDIDLLLS